MVTTFTAKIEASVTEANPSSTSRLPEIAVSATTIGSTATRTLRKARSRIRKIRGSAMSSARSRSRWAVSSISMPARWSLPTTAPGAIARSRSAALTWASSHASPSRCRPSRPTATRNPDPSRATRPRSSGGVSTTATPGIARRSEAAASAPARSPGSRAEPGTNPFDGAQRFAGLLGLCVDHRARRAGLDRDHAHAVRHDVVDLAGDAGPLLHGSQACLLLPFAFGPLRPLAEQLGLAPPVPGVVADDPRAPQERELGGQVGEIAPEL